MPKCWWVPKCYLLSAQVLRARCKHEHACRHVSIQNMQGAEYIIEDCDVTREMLIYKVWCFHQIMLQICSIIWWKDQILYKSISLQMGRRRPVGIDKKGGKSTDWDFLSDFLSPPTQWSCFSYSLKAFQNIASRDQYSRWTLLQLSFSFSFPPTKSRFAPQHPWSLVRM